MRKLSLFVLMLAALASAANAQCDQSEPAHPIAWNYQYWCSYPQGAWTNEKLDPAWSIFHSPVGADPIYAIELYRATTHTQQDNRKVAFAKWKNLPAPADPYCRNGANRTVYEFSILNGVQCTNTVARLGGRSLSFTGCSNAKTRSCSF